MPNTGVIVDQHLTWDNHIKHITSKATKANAFIHKNLNQCPPSVKYNIYKAVAMRMGLYADFLILFVWSHTSTFLSIYIYTAPYFYFQILFVRSPTFALRHGLLSNAAHTAPSVFKFARHRFASLTLYVNYASLIERVMHINTNKHASNPLIAKYILCHTKYFESKLHT